MQWISLNTVVQNQLVISQWLHTFQYTLQDKSTSIAFALNLQEELSHRNPCHEAPAAQFLC